MVAIFTLLVLAVVFMLVTRVATMALVLTGLSHESARFQARSAFLGVGFTTTESEAIVSHPVRRRIVMWLMLIGNIGLLTVLATLVATLLTSAMTHRWWFYGAMLGGGLALVVFLGSNRWLEFHLNRLIAWLLQRWTQLDVRDYVALLQLQNGYAVTELRVEPGDWLAGKTLQEAALSQAGMLMLGIRRSDASFVGAPRGPDRVEAGDTVVLYGQIHLIRELDQRRGESPVPSPRAAPSAAP